MSTPSAMNLTHGTPPVAILRCLISETEEVIKEKELALRGLQLRSQSLPIRFPRPSLATVVQAVTEENQAGTSFAHRSIPPLPKKPAPSVSAPSSQRLHEVATILAKRRRRFESRYRNTFCHQIIDRAIWKSRLSKGKVIGARDEDSMDGCDRGLVHQFVKLSGKNLQPNNGAATDWLLTNEEFVSKPAVPKRAECNLADVPIWDPLVASQQCAVLPCGPRDDDPMEAWYQHQLVNPWTVQERFSFIKLFRKLGNNFEAIAGGLTYKSVREVVSFYYQHMFSFRLDKLRSGRPGRPRVVTDAEILSLARMGSSSVDMRSCK